MSAIPDFGLKWDANIPLIQRRFYCARYGVGNVPTWEQRKEIIQALWGSDKYLWHDWNERRLKAVSSSNWVTWAGPGGTAKTTDAAVIGLEYWLEAPHETAVIMCSTTTEMLRRRIWASVVHYHAQLPKGLGHVGKLIDTSCIIQWARGDAKNGIFGLAVREGPVEDAVNNLVGIHTKRVFLILDEMQGVREAIMEATANMAKNPEFKFLGLGNPESILDPLGKASEPLAGWTSVTPRVSRSWEIHSGPAKGKGVCQVFDGAQSPAITHPDPQYRKRLAGIGLLTQDQIDAAIKDARGNVNKPRLWSQTFGWWPPMGVTNTVLDETILNTFHCRERATWTDGFTRIAALDPAWEGGDDKILQFAKVGQTEVEGKRVWMVEMGRWESVPVNTNSTEPLDWQIVNYCKEQCQKEKVEPASFALDSSGRGESLKGVFEREWGAVVGVAFGGKPSDLPVSDTNPRPAHEEYNYRFSELNYSVREFAIAGGLRGLSTEAAFQFCARKTEYKNKKQTVESKAELKKRIGRSPDHADAVCIAIDLARRKGARPTAEKTTDGDRSWRDAVKKADSYYNQESMLENVA